eukprot:gnl/TRDRNA2_/TRDRNA2_188673_c0_seq1.p1 gnl/TRDRNA2_/TRDRNA2_188673_c0~~gnl/TRDRNA2_/TRDRNA2_188673_c0_seq1.p1  ORF type:complete len:228 (+),score=33.74 gnl/TRDRNA2_/TRDRNA2_188673_c0_seq1:122-805(+)
MPESAIKEFFDSQMQDSANRTCFDGSSASEPQWASVSHGIYIGIRASGAHRSLSVQVSFVRSLELDSWSPLQLRMMELGGNRKLAEFFHQHDIPEDLPIREKYNTRAAKWYRDNLRTIAEGGDPLEPLPAGTGHLPYCGTDAKLDEVYVSAPQAPLSIHDYPRRKELWDVPHDAGMCQQFCYCLKVVLGVPGSSKLYESCRTDDDADLAHASLRAVVDTAGSSSSAP